MMPAAFRIGPVRMNQARADFAISETRITASLLYDGQWEDDGELGVMLSTVTLAVHEGQMRQCWHPLAVVSLHALARRVERGDMRTLDALVGDLGALIDADGEVDRIATSDGFWFGGIIVAKDRGAGRTVRVRKVHTWQPRSYTVHAKPQGQ